MFVTVPCIWRVWHINIWQRGLLEALQNRWRYAVIYSFFAVHIKGQPVVDHTLKAASLLGIFC